MFYSEISGSFYQDILTVVKKRKKKSKNYTPMFKGQLVSYANNRDPSRDVLKHQFTDETQFDDFMSKAAYLMTYGYRKGWIKKEQIREQH